MVIVHFNFIPASWYSNGPASSIKYPHNDILKFKICASRFDYKQDYEVIKLYMKRADQNLLDQRQSPARVVQSRHE